MISLQHTKLTQNSPKVTQNGQHVAILAQNWNNMICQIYNAKMNTKSTYPTSPYPTTPYPKVRSCVLPRVLIKLFLVYMIRPIPSRTWYNFKNTLPHLWWHHDHKNLRIKKSKCTSHFHITSIIISSLKLGSLPRGSAFSAYFLYLDFETNFEFGNVTSITVTLVCCWHDCCYLTVNSIKPKQASPRVSPRWQQTVKAELESHFFWICNAIRDSNADSIQTSFTTL